ncbi:hypothetical protein [Paraburkholderia sp. BL21I4N1]|uniref:hypothetical protein n=1 Tax=Paraburkholderia sp. BL21I4N1 TaxID=1938801 RepID=UPI000CFB7AAD|nr:hypothetical protein [Paraburkholderia sp. BL21I4N1]PQV52731.1 hypothetical protein B0G83_103483 [Paraburkholderia sp. BL21I4N1]
MTIINDFQSQARLFGMLPVLLALGAWYFARGDRLKRAVSVRLVTTRRSHVEARAEVIYLDEERARRQRF